MNNFSQEFEENKEKYALLFGIMLGDGCLSNYLDKDDRERFAVCITCSYYDDREFFENIIIPLLIFLRGKQTKFKERLKEGVIYVNFPDKRLFYKIKTLGFPVGKKGPNLIIPKIFYEKNLLKYIVQGFFATDGCLVLTKNHNKFYPRLESHATHKILLKQICDYLNSLGMKGYFYSSKSKPDPQWKIVRDKYKFQFNGKKNLILFNDIVGFVNPKHKKRFLNFLKYSNEYDKKMGMTLPKEKKVMRKVINSSFYKLVALGRVELPISCS